MSDKTPKGWKAGSKHTAKHIKREVWKPLGFSGNSSRQPTNLRPTGEQVLKHLGVQLKNDKPKNAKNDSGKIETFENLTAALMKVVPKAMQGHAEKNIPPILDQALKRGVQNPDQVAYILATAQHESSFGKPKYNRSESLVEDSNPFKAPSKKGDDWSSVVHTGKNKGTTVTAPSKEKLDENYWDSAYGYRKVLGNKKGTTDGANFRGRGFVQITGRYNYKKMTEVLKTKNFSYTYEGTTYGTEKNPIDLEKHPTHVNKVSELASFLLVEGSVGGHYRKDKLDDHINTKGTDFVNARKVINGDTAKNGKDIGDIAEKFKEVLTKDEAWKKIVKQEAGEQTDLSSDR